MTVIREVNNTGSPLTKPDGTPLKFTQINFVLVNSSGIASDVFDAATGERVIGTTSVMTDASGIFSVQLWPNDRGDAQTQYACAVMYPNAVSFTASLPSGSTPMTWMQLKQSSIPLTPVEVTVLAAYLVQLENQAAAASASATTASTQAGNAAASATSASASATTSSTQASNAAASASAASGSASAASASASTATTQAGISTTQAVNSATSATAAAASATTATTQAGLATTNGAAQVALATTQAGNAATSASNAATSAATATTQAGLATTNGAAQVALATAQASSAASSATAASGSASAAGTSATAASTSAATALSAAGTATTYSTALAAVAGQTAIVPAATLTGFTGAVVASFIYDTKTDSDGGAWRKRCQNTSWYNETTTTTGKWLGFVATEAAARAVSGATTGDYFFATTTSGSVTASHFYSLNATSGVTEVYRGSRREFPEIVGITVEAGRVIIWDFTNSVGAMWMVFLTTANYSLHSGTVNSIAATNGSITIGMSTQAIHVQFITDVVNKRNATDYTKNTLVIGSRNTAGSWIVLNTTAILVNATVNSVAATVLPNSPIDAASGLPVPTIAVGTAGGVSVIRDDGTVVNSSSTTAAYGVSFDYLNRVQWNTTTDINCSPIPPLSASFTASTTSDIKLGSGAYSTSNLQIAPAITTATGLTAKGAIASQSGLTRTKIGQSINSAMIAAITNTYNSGWMVGDIRGAWLADTIAETVSGTELFSNASISDFTTTGDEGLSWSAGVLTITKGSTSNYVFHTLSVVSGKNYVFKWTATAGTGSPYVYVGTSQAGSQVMPPSGAAGAQYFQFTATITGTLYFTFAHNGGATGVTVNYSAFSLVECAADRSVKANPLTVVGTLTKSAVASGSQLMAYSGFSSSNYLQQAYSSNLDFGTGAWGFVVQGIFTATAAKEVIYCRDSVSTGVLIRLQMDVTTSYLSLTAFDGTTTRTATGSTAVDDGTLKTIECSYSAGTLNIRVNGVQYATATGAALLTLNNATAIFRVGVDCQGTNPLTSTSMLALLRPSGTVASADQSAYIYETERKLFEPGAQCCISGATTAVNALSYDDSTDLLSVGTAGTVTEFQGLKAVNTYASTVGTVASLATSGGYKLVGGSTGASFYEPSRLLIEEIARSAAQRAFYGTTLVAQAFTATSSQTTFVLPIGFTPKFVYQQGLLKTYTTGAGNWTYTYDGFRYSVVLGTGATTNDVLNILCVRS